MNKEEFLAALATKLSQLPQEEKEKQLAYYSELIDDMREDGMEETAAVEKLGGAEQIAQTILQEQPLPNLVKNRVKPSGGWTVLNILLLILGAPLWIPLVLALFAIVLSIYIVIWSLIFVLFAIVLSLALAGVALLVGSLFLSGHSFPLILLGIGSGFIFAGLSVFAFLGAVFVTKLLARLTKALARWMKSLFIKKEAGK